MRAEGAMGPPLGCGVCWSSKVKRFVKRQNCLSRTKEDAAVWGGCRKGRAGDFPANWRGGERTLP